MFNGCGTDDTADPLVDQVQRVAITPEEVSIEEGEQVEFSAHLISIAGDTIDLADVDVEWEWWSDDPEVFTVEDGGTATAHNSGEAHCIVQASIAISYEGPVHREGQYVRTGLAPGDRDLLPVSNLELPAGNWVFSHFENIVLKDNLRFTGRDTAIVFVF